MPLDVDLFVLGGGSGGVRAARIAAAYGARVAIAEAREFGGTCVVRGCIPKKLLVYAAEFAHVAEDARAYGWDFPTPRFDWPTLIANKDREIARLSGLYRKTLENHHVTIHDGRAVVVDPHTIEIAGEVAGRRITAQTILIATGGKPDLPSIPGIEHAITSEQAFHIPVLPAHLTIVGGGYIAVEFASILCGLGARVTLIHRGDKVLRGFDEDVRTIVTENLGRLGIEMKLRQEIFGIEKLGSEIRVTCQNSEAYRTGAVLFATGRKPNTAGLGLEAAGVMLSPRGAVMVDRFSQSNVPSIYAVGDCTDRVALTPVAIREGHAFADTVFGNKPTPIEHKLIPTAVFARPPAAGVGLTEADAKQQFERVDVYQTQFRPLFHTLTGRDEPVMMKLVVDATTDRVLGLHMVGPSAPEIVQTAAIALSQGIRKADLDQVFALHPTTAEELVLLRDKRS